MNRLSQTGAVVSVLLAAFTAASGSVAPRNAAAVEVEQPSPPPTKSGVEGVAEGDKLKVAVYNFEQMVEIDASGLEVDIDCAKSYTWNAGPEEIRRLLLLNGCAKITGASSSSVESKAQKSAQDKKLGMWANSQPTTSASPSSVATGTSTRSSGTPGWLTILFSWLGSNWLALLGVIFAGLAVPGVVRWLKRRGYQKSVDIVLFGLGGAGKTDLWTAWADGSAPRSNARPNVEIRRKTGLVPIIWGEYTLIPSLVDGVGGDPAGMLNSLQDVPRKRKRVLIFVIAPHRENTRAEPPIDERYVIEQYGYTSFPRALIGTKLEHVKPDLVILFFAKFDLLSDAPPEDTTSRPIKDELLATFRSLTYDVERDCRNNHIPFGKIVGSAKHGWGIDALQTRVTQLIFTRKAA